jgi:hypothetical protein
MAKPLQSIAIQAPGFFGLNTQDSPTSLSEQYALVAENCVIDQFGRIGARRGWEYVTTSGGSSTNPITISEFIKSDGTTEIITTTASNIYEGTTTLTDITPASYTVSDGNFDTANLNGVIYLFREGDDPVYYDGTTCDEVSAHADYSGTVPSGDIVQSGFGRLWVAKTDTNNTTVYWSDLLTGFKWDTGSSGSIDISKVWPNGADEITAITIHNNFLIIFGKTQILVYTGADDPATMQIADTVVGVGCIARDSIQVTGTDVLFLSDDGLRSFSRTIQEKSAPIRDISKNIRTEMMSLVAGETGRIFSVYSPEEAFYLLHLENNAVTFCFDMRAPLQDGSHRATRWNTINPRCLCRQRDGTLLLGQPDGIAKYDGFTDNSSSYFMSYFTNYIDFGQPSNLKLLKNLKVTIIGGSDTQATLNWGYDYSYLYRKKTFTLAEQIIAEYNIAEYNIGEFNAGVLVNRPSVQASGGGQVVQLGIESEINGSTVSIQRLTAQAILGRTI